jgi:hypothetical protein
MYKEREVLLGYKKTDILALIYYEDGWVKLLLHRPIKDLQLGLELMPNRLDPAPLTHDPIVYLQTFGGRESMVGPTIRQPYRGKFNIF